MVVWSSGMRAVILAAGYGSRLGVLSSVLPKSLIPLANKPVLQHMIENLIQNGVGEIIIVVGHLKNQITRFLNNFNAKGLKVSIIFAKNYEKGPIHSFKACMNELHDDDFALLPGDLLLSPSILSDVLENSQDQKLFLSFDNQRVNSTSTSVYLAKGNGIRKVLGITKSEFGAESEVKSLLPLLICRTDFKDYIERALDLKMSRVVDAVQLYLEQRESVTACMVKGNYWFELDTISEFLSANSFILNNFLENSWNLSEGSNRISTELTLRAPVLVGRDCQIESNCILGPNVSVGDNTIIERNVQVQNAIICPSSRVPVGADINNAIFFKTKSYYI